MQNAFFSIDVQRRGVLAPAQIFQAITASGFQVSMPTIQAMAKKFDPQNAGINFSTYLFMCAHLAHARSIFEVRTHRTSFVPSDRRVPFFFFDI